MAAGVRAGRAGKRLVLKTVVRTGGGWEKVVSVLVDTGSEVSLVRPGLLGEDDLQRASTPIRLVTVSGGGLDGGRRVAKLFLELRSLQGLENKTVDGLFYEAAIGWDLIVGYDFLTKNQMGLLPHKKSLVVEKDGEVKLFLGTDKSQGTPYLEKDIISAECVEEVRGEEGRGGEVHSKKADCVRARGVHVDTMPCAECRESGGSTKIQAVGGKAWTTDDYAVRSDLVSEVVKALDAGIPTVDAFASETNKRFAKFWSVKEDAFEKDWSQEDLLWINAPFQKISEVVQKVVKEKAKAIIIVPEWETEWWWQRVENISMRRFKFRREPIFLKGGKLLQEPPTWDVWAFLVDGGLDHVAKTETLPRMGHRQGDVCCAVEVEHVLRVYDRCGGGDPWPMGCRVESVVKSAGSATLDAYEHSVEKHKAAILKEFGKDVLSGKLVKDPPVRGPYGLAKIVLREGAVPRRQRGFQLTGEREKAVVKIVDEFVERGWLEPSYSEWASTAFVVPKKVEGDWRMVVDYRGLNEVTVHDSYNLPLIDTILQRQAMMKVFTVLDMKKGYHQMPLSQESRPMSAMVTPSGLWQWKVMPMGVKNGNAAFQRMMEWVLKDLPNATPFVDDVIIASGGDTIEEAIENHRKDLEDVMKTFREHQLVCDMSKVKMFVAEVEFCGHILGHGQRRPNPDKLKALEKWARPVTVTELRSFLGFCNWYHDYVDQFAEVAAPLMSMLKVPAGQAKKGSRVKVRWSEEASMAWEELKKRLLGSLMLELVDPSKPFVLKTDASDYAVGAVLEQARERGGRTVDCPVGFWSRKLTKGQRRSWSPREKETYAIVEGLKRWSGYIGLNPVVIKTDHQALEVWHREKIDVPSGPVGRRARWHELLSKFRLKVDYIKGSTNIVADGLSRWAYPAGGAQDVCGHGSKEDDEEVKRMAEEEKEVEVLVVRRVQEKKKCAVVEPKGEEVSAMLRPWAAEYVKSAWWGGVWKETHQDGAKWPDGYQLRGEGDKYLYLGGRICVPEGLANLILQEWHEEVLGHAGREKMRRAVESRFVIPDAGERIIRLLRGCQICQSTAFPKYKEERWTSQPVPGRLGESIALDVVSLPTSRTWDGNAVDAAIVVVDRLSGWIEAWPVAKKGLTSKLVGRLLADRWFGTLGVPAEIVTDNATTFTGQWFATLCAMRGIVHAKAVAYKPQSNGRAERAVGSLVSMLRKCSGDDTWTDALPRVLATLRRTPNNTGLSPYAIVFGRDVLEDGLPLPVEREAEDAIEFKKRMEAVDAKVKDVLEKDHKAAEARQGKGSKPSAAAINKWQPSQGSKCLIRCQGTKTKLQPFWQGPFAVGGRVGKYT